MSRTYRVTKQAVSGVQGSNDIAGYRPRVETDADVDVPLFRMIRIDKQLAGFLDQVNGKLGSTLGMVMLLLVVKVSDSHVRIAKLVGKEED